MSSKSTKINNIGSDNTTSSDAACQSTSFPHRNLNQLYCPVSTYLCAIGSNPLEEGQLSSPRPCIPCAYKLSNFDIALDHEFTKFVPNQRPEQCPRSKKNKATSTNDNSSTTCVKDGMMGYKRGMNVLTVGDGDFSFSLAVAKLVVSDDSESGMVVATSYEDLPTLQRVYPAFDDTMNAVKNYSTKNVIDYKVDATLLQSTLPANVIQSVKFHRICWNFPCTAIGRGQDGQNSAMEENKDLVKKFMANALQFLDECGEIHITHKTKPPYNQWDMEKVAMEEINNNGNELEFEYKGRLVFDKCNLPPYVPRKALDKKSFPCHDACVFVFGFRRKSAESTILDNEKVDFNQNVTASLDSSSSGIIPVTIKLIETVRKKHLTLAMYQKELKHNGKNRRQMTISDGNPRKGKKQRKRKS